MADSRNTKSIGLPPIQLSEKSVFTKSGECQRCAGRRLTWLRKHWRLLLIALMLVGTGVLVALTKLYATDELIENLVAESEMLHDLNQPNLPNIKKDHTEIKLILSMKYSNATDAIRSRRSVSYKNERTRLKRLARKQKRIKRSSHKEADVSNVSTEHSGEMLDLVNKFREMSHNVSLPQNISNEDDADMYHESISAFNETLHEHYKPICSNLNSFVRFCHALRLNLARHNTTYNDGTVRNARTSCDEKCQQCKEGSKLDEQTRKKRCRYKYNPADSEDYSEYRSASEIRTVRTKINKVLKQDVDPKHVSIREEDQTKTHLFHEALCSTDLESFCKAVNHYLNLTANNQRANCPSGLCDDIPDDSNNERSEADVQTTNDGTSNEREVIFTSTTANGNDTADDESEDSGEKDIDDNRKKASEVPNDDEFYVKPTNLPDKNENHDLATNSLAARENEDISSERIVVPTHSTAVPEISKASSNILPNAFATPMCFLGSQVPVFRNDQPGGYGNYYGAPSMPVPQNMMGYGYNYPGHPSMPPHVDPYFGDRYQYPGYGVPYGYQPMPPPAPSMAPAPLPAPTSAPCPAVISREGHPADSGAVPGVHIAFNYRDAEDEVECGLGFRRCDSGRCISKKAWCDGDVHCADASDERNCGCSARLDQSKICDGYFDCPKGEDEMGCFGCRSSSFSCNDWTEKSPKTTCFDNLQRCNFIADCPNGRDESDCNLLTDHFDDHPIFAISHSKGFLHRNFRGTWYPVCGNPYQWAQQACTQENGPLQRAPYIQMTQVDHDHKEEFLNHVALNFVQMSPKCYNNSAIYVTCPDMDCGTRLSALNQHLHRKNDLLTSRLKRQSGRLLNLMVNQMRNDAIEAHVRPIIHDDPLGYGYLAPTSFTQTKFNQNVPELSSSYGQLNYNNRAQRTDAVYSETPFTTTHNSHKDPTLANNGASYLSKQETLGIHDYNLQNGYVSKETDKTNLEQKRGKRGEGRVVGGKESDPAAWPWVVAMYRDGLFHCGGTIISEMWILSAAHCVDKYWKHFYEIQAGVLRRLSFSPQEQSRTVTHVIVNQYYDRSNMRNDLSLLRMMEPLKFNRWVRPACLPSPHTAGASWWWGPPSATVCTAVGWGALQEHGPDPDHMHEVEVPIVQCKHREDRAGREICAGEVEGGKDACQGDSGGPLLCRSPLKSEQWYLAGIVSHGEGCARRNEPGAYTRVSLYVEWIAEYLFSGDELLPSRQPLHNCPGFSCTSGIARCLPKKRVCDKIIDCLNSEDEIDCSNIKKSDDDLIDMDMRSANDSKEKGMNNITIALYPTVSENVKSNGEPTTPAETKIKTYSASGEAGKINTERENKIDSNSESKEGVTENLWALSSESEVSATQINSEIENTASWNSESKERFTEISISNSNTENTWSWNGELKEGDTFRNNKKDPIPDMQSSKDSDRSSTEFILSTTLGPNILKHFNSSGNDVNESNKNESITVPTTTSPDNDIVHSDKDDIETKFKKLNKKMSAVFSGNNITFPVLNNDTNSFNSLDNNIPEESDTFSNNTTEDTLINSTDRIDTHHSSLNPNESIFNDSKKSNISEDLANDVKPEHFENNIVVNDTHKDIPLNDTSEIISNITKKDEGPNCEHSKEPTPNISNNSIAVIKNINASATDQLTIQTTAMPIEKPFPNRKDFVLIPAQLHRSEQHPIVYKCRSMKQIIPFELRCDNRLDCEDGSDENGCSCLDYIVTLNPSLRCDGYIDCADGIDEVNCDICPEDYFLCKASKMCLPNNQVCDGVKHCELAEDESDCFALTNGKVMTFDLYGRPDINLFGLFTKKVSKWWEVACKTDSTDEEDQEATAHHICNYLGFSGYDDYNLKKIDMEYFNTRFSHVNGSESRIVRPSEYMKTKECTALYVRCHATLNTNIEAHRLFTEPEKRTDLDIFRQLDMKGNNEFEWPWVAKIYMEGIYRCTGVLTDNYWIIINEKCLQHVSMNDHYVIAVLGVGAWTQELSVDLKVPVSLSSVSMLRLHQAANVTRHVRPMPVQDLKLKDRHSEACIAVGTDRYNKTSTVFLEEVDNDCGKKNRCFIRHSKHHSNACVDGMYTGVPWNGIISCLGERGWFPAAVFEESRGDCGFQDQMVGQTLAHLRTDIKTIIFSWEGPGNRFPQCAGWRCDRGACVPWSRVCDGTRDCATGEDERDGACEGKKDACKLEQFHDQCGCKADELRCKSGKCVSKLAFGDGIKDCEDGGDEHIALLGRAAEQAATRPVPCARYLARVAPHRLCDGDLHCRDRSDEDPAYCKCFSRKSIPCKYSKTCVSPDMICDGERDCPYGDDEDMCIGLRTLPGMNYAQGEVMVQSYGIWHTKCFDRERHTRTELENICRQMGFIGGHAVELIAPPSAPHRSVAVAGQTIGVKIANFSNVTFNNKTSLYLRNSDEPFAKAVVANGSENCHVLYIECL